MFCLLHDVVEDTDTPLTVIVSLFGALMWKRLLLVSKKVPVFDPVTGEVRGRTKKALAVYFDEIRTADLVVRRGKLLDRLDNLSDMRAFTFARRKKYLCETRRYLLRIAVNTDVGLSIQLEALCKQVGASLKQTQPKLTS